ncbi:MAG: esterase-like activity of phytase family protein [Candidatus Promineifilaceae bacterium]|nr:esterase-like activity of phytase family protein [Candidatus Promineifilaceae bacterium]
MKLSRLFSRLLLTVALVATVVLLSHSATLAKPSDDAQTVVGVEFLGEVVVPTGTLFEGTEIGGLSSITYDHGRDVYHVLSDDQGNRPTGDPVRYYTVEIDLADGALEEGDVDFVEVTQLYEERKIPFAPGGLDPEGFVLGREGYLMMSSEGNILADPIIDPFIRRYNLNGRVTAALPIPDKYIPNGVDKGVRFNLGFESLNLTPDNRRLVTAGEGALFQDGPASTFDHGSLARILIYDLSRRLPIAEYVYEVGPWAEPSTIFGVNGIVELLPIDNVGTILVMERSFSVGGVLGGGTGNVVVINEVSTQGATDVLAIDALYQGGTPVDFTPVTQREVFAFDDLGIPIDNIEGMTFGPNLADGRQTLVIVSDNNFSPGQFTQFVVLALDIQPVE